MDNNLKLEITEELAGMRLDQAMAGLLPNYSRSQIQQWIQKGHVLLDGLPPRQRDKVATGSIVELSVPPVVVSEAQAEAIPLNIVHEDQGVLVINKPAGLVVHPGAGNLSGTLMNALIHHDKNLSCLPRAGIVHRIDKDTTGLLVIAKTESIRLKLIEQFEHHRLERTYVAIVDGVLVAGSSVDAPVGRHPRDRMRMAVNPNGKKAVTHYRIKNKYRSHTSLSLTLETGRTHQIRVHMAHIKHPIIGDPLYGGRLKIPPASTDQLKNELKLFKRQALHAMRLKMNHPLSNEVVEWQCELPDDMQNLITALSNDLTSSQARS